MFGPIIRFCSCHMLKTTPSMNHLFFQSMHLPFYIACHLAFVGEPKMVVWKMSLGISRKCLVSIAKYTDEQVVHSTVFFNHFAVSICMKCTCSLAIDEFSFMFSLWSYIKRIARTYFELLFSWFLIICLISIKKRKIYYYNTLR